MVVIDTSIVYKWTDKNEKLRENSLKILDAHLHNQIKIIVPNLILYELANAWATKTGITFSRIKSNFQDLEDTNLQIIPISFGIMEKAAKFSRKHKVSVYDASYAVLARENNCNLITADSKFVNKVNLPFVKHLSSYH